MFFDHASYFLDGLQSAAVDPLQEMFTAFFCPDSRDVFPQFSGLLFDGPGACGFEALSSELHEGGATAVVDVGRGA